MYQIGRTRENAATPRAPADPAARYLFQRGGTIRRSWGILGRRPSSEAPPRRPPPITELE